jgi:hypothetical protein
VSAPQPSAEWKRLSSAPSLADVVASHVTDFRPLPVGGVLPSASRAFVVPERWYIAAPGDTTERPVRAFVTGHRSRGGWQGCDTLAAFGFTGIPPAKDIVDRAACTLRALDASSVTTRMLDIPAIPGACAVRSSGYFTAARLRLWGQFSTYIAGSEQPCNGRLVQHSLFVMTQRRTQLRTAIADLSDAVHTAFRTITQPA